MARLVKAGLSNIIYNMPKKAYKAVESPIKSIVNAINNPNFDYKNINYDTFVSEITGIQKYVNTGKNISIFDYNLLSDNSTVATANTNSNYGRTASSSSSPNYLSLNTTLSSKRDVENWAALHGVSYTRTWGCLEYAKTRKGIPFVAYPHAKYAVEDKCRMYALMGYNVSQTPSVGSMLVYGTHAVYVESMNADGSLNISEANHNNDFSYRTINPPANGYYVA